VGVSVEERAARDAAAGYAPPEEVVWHDLECGSYDADLALWQSLAEAAGCAAILDVGAGTGRVTLDLARCGHRVTAMDLSPVLLDALRARADAGGAGERSVQTVCADARAFELAERGFALALMPMQTLQLLGGSTARVACFTCVRAHLRADALLACAIVTALEPFDCAAGDLGPAPERVLVADRLYVSRPTRVHVLESAVAIERERRIVASPDGAGAPRDATAVAERNIVKLDRVTVARLQREALQAGLTPAGVREIPPTAEHVGSSVVVFRA
jgi:SAM-dependent methyltransferase